MTRAARATSTTGKVARRSARTSATVAAALLTASLLAACAEDESPQQPSPGDTTTAAPTDDSSPSPEPSEPEVEKPERPAAMDKKDAEGAAAAVTYFLTLEPYMLATGDTVDYEAMAFKTCGYCDSVLENQKWLQETGSRYVGGTKSVEILRKYKRDEATGIFPMDVRVKTEPIDVLDSKGKEVDHVGAESTDLRAEVALVDEAWIIAGLPAAPKS